MSNDKSHVICNKEADIAVIKNDVATIRSDMSAIKSSIIGNGVPGLMTRTAKLEQLAGGAVWLAGVMVVTVLGLIVDFVRRVI